MKNLKQLAAQFGMYQENDIPEQFKTNLAHRLDLAKGETIPDFLKSSPLVEIGLFYECKTQDKGTPKEYHYIDNNYILLKSVSNDILLMLSGNDYHNKGKYWFNLYYGFSRKYSAISYYKRDTALKAITEPNKIGVFTDKKVKDWLQYTVEYVAIMDNLLNTVNAKNIEIQQQIEDFKNSLPNCKHQSYDGKTWIETNLFEVLFTHDKESNYLQTKITFKGTIADVTRLNSF